MENQDTNQDKSQNQKCPETSSCSGCSCSTPGPWRWIVMAVVAVIIIIVLAKSFNSSNNPANKSAQTSASQQKPDAPTANANKPVQTSASQNKSDTPSINWSHDYQAAMAKANRENKPVLLAFHATWCPPCRQMKQITYLDPKVIRSMESFVPIFIDVDKQGRIAQKYKIGPIPSYTITAPNGTVIDSFVGSYPADEFAAKLKAALDKNP